jgi:hypothetical protein
MLGHRLPIKRVSPPSWLRRLRPASQELCTFRDVWQLAEGAAGSDGAYSCGISPGGAKTGQEPFPTMSWERRGKPRSCHNTDNSLGLFVASRARSGPVSSVQVVGCGSCGPGAGVVFDFLLWPFRFLPPRHVTSPSQDNDDQHLGDPVPVRRKRLGGHTSTS